MRRRVTMLMATVVLTSMLAVGGAGAEGKMTITREESKPKDVEVKAGEEIRFINLSGQTVHVWFGGSGTAPRFYVPAGSGGARVKFDKPGTYEYTAHVTGGKVHAHTGSVVVK